ncbi:MAG: hypothetical protein CMC55_04120 [Flavobacteriaceae bacterium]|nr:hypothetical protein [Flavobacteriaceae bacterium]
MEQSLSNKVDEINKTLSEIYDNKTKEKKKKKFKLPLGILFQKGKLKKDHILVCMIKSNKQAQFRVEKIKEDTIMIDEAIYDARSGNILNYKGMPLMIIQEWNTEPTISAEGEEERKKEFKIFNPKDNYDEAEKYGTLTSPLKVILTRMKMEAVKPTANFNAKTIMTIILLLGGIWFALDYFQILA